MTTLIITAVAVVCIAWLGLGLVDRPKTVTELPRSALPKDCANSGDFNKPPDTRMDDAFQSALDRGFKWVEAVPHEESILIVGHTTKTGRWKTFNWSRGKP